VTNIRIHPPRLLVDSVSSLDSIEVVFAVCRKTIPTTHAVMVSARVGGDDRDDIQVNRNMVGRRLEKPAATYPISDSYAKQ
jgi:hypothetical protein